MKYVSIAIDGPAGAGKSTLARAVAKELGYVYVDSGAIYRTVGYHMSMMGIGPRDVDGVTRLIDDVNLKIVYDAEGLQHMLLGGYDVTGEIRTQEMGDYASKLSTLKVVRDFLLDVQRQLAETHNVVMDGRDIGTVVLPNADVKIFLTASPEVRAKRRFLELQQKGDRKATLQKVLQEIKERDERDANRAIAPLKPAADSILLDTSELGLQEAVAAMKSIIEERLRA